MARAPARRLLLTVAVSAWACFAGCTDDGPEPSLERIDPGRGYSDRPQRLILRGHGFLPSFHVDATTGRRQSDASAFWGYVGLGADSARLYDFGWRGPDELSATLEPGLPLGMHGVTVVDPRGRRALLPTGFWALGEDKDPPRITFQSPDADAQLAPGSRVHVRVRVSDQPGHLQEVSWEVQGPSDVLLANACPVPPDVSTVDCDFEVQVPLNLRPGDSFGLRVSARDDALHPNDSRDMRSFILVSGPEVAQVQPASGGSAGGTEVLVTGSGFVPGSRVLVGGVPLYPDGGIRVDDHTFTGRTPAHPAGVVPVTVETPVATAAVAVAFQYLATPRPTSVAPAEGRAEGGDKIHVMGDNFTCNTKIFLGQKLSTALPLMEPADAPCPTPRREIVGIAPAGSGRATVWAFDPVAGWGALPDAFTWVPAPDAGASGPLGIEDSTP